METVILMDRTEAVGCVDVTYERYNGKIFWHENKIRIWGDCRFKFVVTEDKLVIAPVTTHFEVYLLYLTRDLSVDDARLQLRNYEFHREMDKNGPRVTLAGKIGDLGKITEWGSAHFQPPYPNLDTAEEFAELFNNLFWEGMLSP